MGCETKVEKTLKNTFFPAACSKKRSKAFLAQVLLPFRSREFLPGATADTSRQSSTGIFPTMNGLMHQLFPRVSVPLAAALLLVTEPAFATVLSQDTTGITHSAGGDGGIQDSIGFSTSGGPSGAAGPTLSLQIDAPSGQVFDFDSSAYPATDFSFEFRPIVSGDFTGVTATNPTFTLLNPTGNLSLTLVSSSATDFGGGIQFYFDTLYTISGAGTFSGFRLDTTMQNTSGQTITWGGGDSAVFSSTGADAGPVLTLVAVPEPLPLAPAAATVLVALFMTGRRRSRRGPRFDR